MRVAVIQTPEGVLTITLKFSSCSDLLIWWIAALEHVDRHFRNIPYVLPIDYEVRSIAPAPDAKDAGTVPSDGAVFVGGTTVRYLDVLRYVLEHQLTILHERRCLAGLILNYIQVEGFTAAIEAVLVVVVDDGGEVRGYRSEIVDGRRHICSSDERGRDNDME